MKLKVEKDKGGQYVIYKDKKYYLHIWDENYDEFIIKEIWKEPNNEEFVIIEEKNNENK